MAAYYRRHGGAVISTAVKSYIYITVNRKFDDRFRLSYSMTEEVSSVSEIKHRLFRAILEQIEVAGGVEITSVARHSVARYWAGIIQFICGWAPQRTPRLQRPVCH